MWRLRWSQAPGEELQFEDELARRSLFAKRRPQPLSRHRAVAELVRVDAGVPRVQVLFSSDQRRKARRSVVVVIGCRVESGEESLGSREESTLSAS